MMSDSWLLIFVQSLRESSAAKDALLAEERALRVAAETNLAHASGSNEAAARSAQEAQTALVEKERLLQAAREDAARRDEELVALWQQVEAAQAAVSSAPAGAG